MPTAVERRDRWLALILLLLALALGYLALVHPWWTLPMREVQQDIAESNERELRLRMQVRQAPEIEHRLAAAREQAAQQPGFLPESSVELAIASLVQRLETVVAEASPGNRSCAITSRSPLTANSEYSRFRRAAVQVRLQCGTPELAAVLHALESGSPRLFVDNVNILTQRYYTPDASNTGGGLDVGFDLYGYLRSAQATQTATNGTEDADAR